MDCSRTAREAAALRGRGFEVLRAPSAMEVELDGLGLVEVPVVSAHADLGSRLGSSFM